MLPVLYSFRRCPYAMRARLAISSAGLRVELREIVLRDKAPELLSASAKGTVPVLVGDTVIDESLDVMAWALAQNDPECWLDMPDAGHALIAQNDGAFKAALDRYKYPNRYDGADPDARGTAAVILHGLDQRLAGGWLFGDRPTLADMAILPFIRQFAHVDKSWFDTQDWPHLQGWLARFLASDRFASIMGKYPKWQSGDVPVYFVQNKA